MDGVLVDFKSAYPKLTEEERIQFNPKNLPDEEADYDKVPNIFSRMEPIKGAIKAYELLSKKYDTYILSTAPWENPTAWSDKLNWVKEHLGITAYKRLILSHNKNLNLGDFLIDDRRKNGASEFNGELIEFGSCKYPDWDSITNYLIKKRDVFPLRIFICFPRWYDLLGKIFLIGLVLLWVLMFIPNNQIASFASSTITYLGLGIFAVSVIIGIIMYLYTSLKK